MFDTFAVSIDGKPEYVGTDSDIASAINFLLQHWHEEESAFRLFHIMSNGCVVATLFSGSDSEVVTVTEQRKSESIVASYRVRYALDSEGSYLSTEVSCFGFHKVTHR